MSALDDEQNSEDTVKFRLILKMILMSKVGYEMRHIRVCSFVLTVGSVHGILYKLGLLKFII